MQPRPRAPRGRARLPLGASLVLAALLSISPRERAFAACRGAPAPAGCWGAGAAGVGRRHGSATRRAQAEGSSEGSGPDGFWAPNVKVVRAIQAGGGSVTRADVLERAGVEAAGLEEELLQIARCSGATLSVNDAGELLYCFPKRLATVLARESAAARWQQRWLRSKGFLIRGGKMAVGGMVVAVVGLMIVGVIAMSSTSSSDSNKREGSTGAWGGRVMLDMIDLIMTPARYDFYTGRRWPIHGPNVLEAIYSFMFGDGDPNAWRRDEFRYKLMAEVIAQNGGAVVAEQLAPFLDPPEWHESLDTAVLPALVRFQGRPEVNSEGDIVYVFPQFQESTGDVKSSSSSSSKTVYELGITEDWEERKFLQEVPEKFSDADGIQVWTAGTLGFLLTMYTISFGLKMSSGQAAFAMQQSGLVRLLVRVYPLIAGFAFAYVGLPINRWLRLGRRNEQIRERNAWRERAAELVRKPVPELQKRLRATKAWARRRLRFGKAVYDSSKSSEGRQEAEQLGSFDRRLADK